MRVDGPVSTSSAASGTEVSGGVSRNRNAWIPSPNVHGSPAVPTCQFPPPSVSHQEKPGVQLYANQSATGGSPVLTTCRWLSPAAELSPATAIRPPPTSGSTAASGANSSGTPAGTGASRCATTLAHSAGMSAAGGTVMPCPAAPSRRHSAAS
jgi:hypothetical protein